MEEHKREILHIFAWEFVLIVAAALSIIGGFYIGEWAVTAIMLVVCVAAGLVLHRRDVIRWLRRRKGRCPACGYDLTCNVSGVCPECGTPVSVTPSR